MVSTTTGERGKVKKLKMTQTNRALASGYGAEGLCLLTCLPSRGVANRTQNPFSPTHPYGRRETGSDTGERNANRQVKQAVEGSQEG